MKKRCSKCRKLLSRRFFDRDYQKKDKLTSRCKECIRKQGWDYYEKNKLKRNEYSNKYYVRYKDKIKKWSRNKRKNIIVELFKILGNKCAICKIKDKQLLQIDHKNGGGAKHRRIKGVHYMYYKDILLKTKKGNKKFRLLCSNCNIKEAIKKGDRISIWE